MLRSESVKVGAAYVNEGQGLIRDVVEELDGFRIRFNEFDLKTGRLVIPPLRTAYRRPFARWAVREATPAELVRLHPTVRHSWIKPASPDEARQSEREIRRARMEQVVASSVMHRW